MAPSGGSRSCTPAGLIERVASCSVQPFDRTSRPLLACGIPLRVRPDPWIATPPSLPSADVTLRAPLTRGSTSPAASRPGSLPRCERLRCFRSPSRRVLFNDALPRRRSVFAHTSDRASCPASEAVPFGPCLFAGATPCTGRSPLSRLALGDPDPGVGPSVHGRFASFAGRLSLRLAPSVPAPRSGVPRLDRESEVTSVPPSHH